jgi:hypothetical protein
MNTMPLNVAQQLVADRRASYEAVAGRRSLRRLVSRRDTYGAPSATPLPRRAPVAVARRRGGSPEAAPVCTVA